jgi:hypothetical protein
VTRDELIDKIATSIAFVEGFYKKGKYPTVAQRLANPGNIRQWRKHGRAYPRSHGYVDFVAWARRSLPDGTPASEVAAAAEAEGWRVLRVLIGQYIDGRYHAGVSPTLLEMFRVFAPAEDGNRPESYAKVVARRAGIPLDRPLRELID